VEAKVRPRVFDRLQHPHDGCRVTVALVRQRHRAHPGGGRWPDPARRRDRARSELALTTLEADAARITKAATEFATIQSTLAPRMSALTKELRNTALCLLVACLILTACATSTPQSMLPTKAPLDSALSAPCQLVERPGADDYHAWQAWVIELLRLYATCPGRHAKTVQAWPK